MEKTRLTIKGGDHFYYTKESINHHGSHNTIHNSSILTHLDSLSSNLNYPTIVKQYYRPQLQRSKNINHNYNEDSFLIDSSDALRPQFQRVYIENSAESIMYDNDNTNKRYSKRNNNSRISIVQSSHNRHSSITFASIFKQSSTSDLNTNNNQIIINTPHTYENAAFSIEDEFTQVTKFETPIVVVTAPPPKSSVQTFDESNNINLDLVSLNAAPEQNADSTTNSRNSDINYSFGDHVQPPSASSYSSSGSSSLSSSILIFLIF